MHPDKGARSVRTDVLTDSETIYEILIRVRMTPEGPLVILIALPVISVYKKA